MNVLGIGLDYLMLQDDKVRGDVRKRQVDYARYLSEFYQVIYSPKSYGFKDEQWGNNLWVYPTNSISKNHFFIDALRIAERLCREKKIDAITSEDPFVTGLVGYLLKKRFGVPLNVQTHIDFVDNEYWIALRKMNRFFNFLGKFICKRADTIRVVARETKEKLEACGISAEKISLISVHSELRHFNNPDGTEIRKSFLKKGFKNILIFVGRLVEQKDIPNLFNAFEIVLKRFPKTLLLIVGQGPLRETLERLSQEMAIDKNVIFTGAIDHSEIQEYYAASDMFVLPSIFEGRATVVVEALLSKKPIVTTDVSGVYDWIEEGKNGFIVKRKDPKAFAEKVCWLLEHPEEKEVFGNKAYELARSRLSEIGDITTMIKLWEKTADMGKK